MDATKQKIISKSLDLFTHVGVKVVTMDMISEELGMSKKTLYEHFSSKEELIKQSFNESLTSSLENLNNKINNSDNAIQQYFLLTYNLENLFFIRNDQITFQLEKFYPEIYSEILNIQKQFLKTLLKNNITLGIGEELYRAKINKKLTVEFIYLSEQVFAKDSTKAQSKNLRNDSKVYFTELVLRSISSKKGLKELEKTLLNYAPATEK